MLQATALVDLLRSAQSVILSTHRNSDGDGLGAQIAVYHGLRQLGKQVRILNVDRPARKYDFLAADAMIEVYRPGLALPTVDCVLIFDTNDARRVEPLYSALLTSLKGQVDKICFVDHHPVLQNGPAPTPSSLVDISAASTGEMAYRILQNLGVKITTEIARALYTALVFDTQMFRYVKSDPRSHAMAAELLKFEKKPEEIHRRLFSTYTVEKMKFLALALSQVEYFAGDRLAFIKIDRETLLSYGLDLEETGDVIDLVMNIDSVEAAALVREDTPGHCKISFRSKGVLRVLPIAEIWGGGGHPFSAGANVDGDIDKLARDIKAQLQKSLEAAT